MNPSLTLNPFIWVCLFAVLLYVLLGVTSWRRHLVPGARPFALICLFLALWTFGEMMELAAATLPAKQFWFRFQTLWQLPTLTAAIFFTLQFAGLGRRLTRRVSLLLCLPPLLTAVLIVTNDAHLLFWSTDAYSGGVPPLGPAGHLIVAYTYALTVLNMSVLLWLFFRSPPDRWAIASIMVGNFVVRSAVIVDRANSSPFAPLDAVVVCLIVLAVSYALALFRFRIFDPVRLARGLALEQMGEGMVVIDTAGRVADMNPKAAAILGLPATAARGQPAAGLFPADFPSLDAIAGATGGAVAQNDGTFALGEGDRRRYYVAQAWPLRDRHHGPLGRLLLLRDVTEQRQVEQRLMAQQRALATLLERERLANELHDGLGQVLAYVGLQAGTTRKQLADGRLDMVDAQLAGLAAAAQNAQLDLRESILSLKTSPSVARTFTSALDHYLAGYRELYGIRADMTFDDGLADPFAPETGVQLMRVIQEALANAQRHGGAQAVSVALARHNGGARLTISDDGRGFDAAALPKDGHYGLAIMRERVAQIDGCLNIDSQPGTGTRIVVDAPLMPLPEAHL